MNNLPHVPRSRARGRVAAQGPLMLVITPTRELAQQIEEVCRAIARRTGHTSVTVVGGVSYNPQRDKLTRGCDIRLAPPGRLQDLIDQGACSLDQVQVLVLAEADRMLDMGCRPAVRCVVNFDVPEAPVDYLPRIGRTGRAGEEGWSLTFVTVDDVDGFYDIEALMGKTAEIFDADGLELGPHAPEVDPDRVPAKAPAGKTEKKRRRKATARAKAERSSGSKRPDVAPKAPQGVKEDAPKPSRRKRSGKTRVHAEEASEPVELLTASEVRGERAASQDRSTSRPSKKGAARSGGLANGRKREDDRSRPERSCRDDRRRSGREDRSDRPRSDRGDSARNCGVRSGRDAWRNYDEPSERRGRGGRGGRGSQPGNSVRGGRGGSYEQRSGAPRSGRRPGDRGGRR